MTPRFLWAILSGALLILAGCAGAGRPAEEAGTGPRLAIRLSGLGGTVPVVRELLPDGLGREIPLVEAGTGMVAFVADRAAYRIE